MLKIISFDLVAVDWSSNLLLLSDGCSEFFYRGYLLEGETGEQNNLRVLGKNFKTTLFGVYKPN